MPKMQCWTGDVKEFVPRGVGMIRPYLAALRLGLLYRIDNSLLRVDRTNGRKNPASSPCRMVSSN